MTDNAPVRRYANQMENRIMFSIKRVYQLEILMPESLKLHGSTKGRTTKH